MINPKTPFICLFGETPFIKALDFFLTYDDFDYSKCQVAEETGVARMTMDNVWNELIRKQIIVKTRVIGRAEMYKLNKKSQIVKVLLDFDMKLCSSAVRNELVSVKNSVIV
ncbi:MAG: hypothetical protein PHU12_01390 [Candidatus Aenigmarchaeota archaeon]|nr:hypothetical protein [Candidatus Aenigmarchaeota archaeon]